MDSERQPLLRRTDSRRFRYLTLDEVLQARQAVVWRGVRFCLVIMFWAIIAMFLSIVTSILVQTRCSDAVLNPMPSVPPVHMSFAPLMAGVYAS